MTDCASPERDAVLAEEQHRACRRGAPAWSVTSEKRPSATVTRSPRRSRRAAPGGDDLLAAAVEDPRAEQGVAVVDEGAAEQDRAGASDASSGRTPSFLTSTCAACAGPQRDGAGLGGRRVRRTRPGGIRTLEEPEAELEAQHAAHRVVDERELDLAGVDELLEVREVGAAAPCRGRRRPGSRGPPPRAGRRRRPGRRAGRCRSSRRRPCRRSPTRP